MKIKINYIHTHTAQKANALFLFTYTSTFMAWMFQNNVLICQFLFTVSNLNQLNMRILARVASFLKY